MRDRSSSIVLKTDRAFSAIAPTTVRWQKLGTFKVSLLPTTAFLATEASKSHAQLTSIPIPRPARTDGCAAGDRVRNQVAPDSEQISRHKHGKAVDADVPLQLAQ